MKRLTPNPRLNPEVWFPEDGVDFRTAASIEPAIQALLDRIEFQNIIPPRIRPFLGAGIRLAYSTNKKVTNNNTYLWIAQTTYSPYLWRVELGTMAESSLTINPYDVYIQALRVSKTTGTLLAAISADGTNTTVYRSTDNGNTWTLVLTASGAANVYIGWNSNTAILGRGAKVWISTNDGQSWTPQTANLDLGIWYDVIFSMGRWWVLSDQGIFWSVNGVTWTKETGTWTNLLLNSRFVEHNGLLYLPVKPLAAWNGTGFINLGISTAALFGALKGRPIFFTNDSSPPILVDLQTMTGVMHPPVQLFSDTLALWKDGLA